MIFENKFIAFTKSEKNTRDKATTNWHSPFSSLRNIKVRECAHMEEGSRKPEELRALIRWEECGEKHIST